MFNATQKPAAVVEVLDIKAREKSDHSKFQSLFKDLVQQLATVRSCASAMTRPKTLQNTLEGIKNAPKLRRSELTEKVTCLGCSFEPALPTNKVGLPLSFVSGSATSNLDSILSGSCGLNDCLRSWISDQF